jgi:hypothetical protein
VNVGAALGASLRQRQPADVGVEGLRFMVWGLGLKV